MSSKLVKSSWCVMVDPYAVDVNAKLGKAPPKTRYNFNVSPQCIEVKMLACCSPASYICAIENVVKCDLVKSEFCLPSLVLVEETEEASITSKFFMADAGDSDHAVSMIETIRDLVAALKRLQDSAIIVAGALDPKAPPTADAITFFKPKEATKIFNTYNQLQTAKVGTTETIFLPEGYGQIAVTRTGKGVKMLARGEGWGESIDHSCFVKVISHMKIKLAVVEEVETSADGETTETVFRFRVPQESDDPDSNAVWLNIEVPSNVALECPETAGLAGYKKNKAPKTRARVNSHVESMKNIQRSLSMTKKPAEEAKVEADTVGDATAADKVDGPAAEASPPTTAKTDSQEKKSISTSVKGMLNVRGRTTSAAPKPEAAGDNGKKAKPEVPGDNGKK